MAGLNSLEDDELAEIELTYSTLDDIHQAWPLFGRPAVCIIQVQACLDLICGWVNDGAPRRKTLVLAKYGEWESIVGGIIDWIAPNVRFLADHRTEPLAIDSERDETDHFPGAP